MDGPSPNFGNPPPRNSDSQTQQTHVGSNANSSGTTIRHTADTQGGNSGSPIIDNSTGKAIGVHTHGGCSSTGGNNRGTSTYHSSFWNALHPSLTIRIDQQRKDGTRLVNTVVGIWNGSLFESITIPPSPQQLPTIPTNVGRREVFRGWQELISNPNEKYHVWRRGSVDQFDTVQNHRGFTIRSDDGTFISRFNNTYSSITFKNEFWEVIGLNPLDDFIQFKDPWLVDVTDSRFYDPPYGYRNLGMSAPFKQESSPFTPTLQSKYKGVFLNQVPDPNNPNKPYYSVRAISPQDIPLQHTGRTHNFYFQNWSANPQGSANFQNANALETPVVFNQQNATVQANLKGTQLSNNPNTYSKGSQRKFIRITNGRLYSVNESVLNLRKSV